MDLNHARLPIPPLRPGMLVPLDVRLGRTCEQRLMGCIDIFAASLIFCQRNRWSRSKCEEPRIARAEVSQTADTSTVTFYRLPAQLRLEFQRLTICGEILSHEQGR